MSGQEGPVEPGRPPVVHMDLDRAVGVLASFVADGPDNDQESGHAALGALQALVDRARQYVAGPTSGRLAALAQVLQEPVPDEPRPVNAETVAQAWLTERDLIVVSRSAAERLGIFPP